MSHFGRLILVCILAISVSFSEGEFVCLDSGQFLDSYLFSSHDSLNNRVDVRLLYSQIQGDQDIRAPASFAPVYIYIEEEDRLPRLAKVITGEDGKATIDLSEFESCAKLSFVYSSGIDPLLEFRSVGIELAEFGYDQLSDIPCFDGGGCEAGVQDPLQMRAAYSVSEVCPNLAQPAPVTPAFCLPAIIIFALLGGAMYLSGRNPFSVLDLSSPRMGKLHQYSARTRAMSFDASGIAAGATKLGRVATDSQGVKKEERQREEAVKGRTGIKSGFVAMTLGQGVLAPFSDRQLGFRSGAVRLKGKDVSKKTDDKAAKETPSLNRAKEQPGLFSRITGLDRETKQNLRNIAYRDVGIAGLVGSIMDAPPGQKMGAFLASLARGSSLSPVFYATGLESIDKLFKYVNEKDALDLISGGDLKKGKEYTSNNGKSYTIKAGVDKDGGFAFVLVEGKKETNATDKNVPADVRREVTQDLLERISLGHNSLRANLNDFDIKQGQAKEKIISILESPSGAAVIEQAVDLFSRKAQGASTPAEKAYFTSQFPVEGLDIDLTLFNRQTSEGKAAFSKLTNDASMREQIAAKLVENPTILNQIISEGNFKGTAKYDLLLASAGAMSAYARQVEYSAVSRLADESTALLTRLDSDKSYKPSTALVSQLGEYSAKAVAANISATQALQLFENQVVAFEKNPTDAKAATQLADSTVSLTAAIYDKISADLKYQGAYRLAQYDEKGSSLNLLESFGAATQDLSRDILSLQDIRKSVESAKANASDDAKAKLDAQIQELDAKISNLTVYKDSMAKSEQTVFMSMFEMLPKQDGKITQDDQKYYGSLVGSLETVSAKYVYGSPDNPDGTALARIRELEESSKFRSAQASFEQARDEANGDKSTIAMINREINELNALYGYKTKDLSAAINSDIERASKDNWAPKQDPVATIQVPIILDEYAMIRTLQSKDPSEVAKKQEVLTNYGIPDISGLLNNSTSPSEKIRAIAHLAQNDLINDELIKRNVAIAVAQASDDENLKILYANYQKYEKKVGAGRLEEKDADAFERITEGITKEVFRDPKRLITEDVISDVVTRQETISKKKALFEERKTYGIPIADADYISARFVRKTSSLSEAYISNLLKARASKQ